jgi:hypothetical protein
MCDSCKLVQKQLVVKLDLRNCEKGIGYTILINSLIVVSLVLFVVVMSEPVGVVPFKIKNMSFYEMQIEGKYIPERTVFVFVLRVVVVMFVSERKCQSLIFYCFPSNFALSLYLNYLFRK